MRVLLFALTIALSIVPAAGGPWAQALVTVERDGGIYAGELEVPIDKSQILRIDRPYTDLLIGNPEIADVLPMTDRSVYVLGKAHGSTSLTIYGPGRIPLAVVDVSVTHDSEGLKRRLFELMPNETVEVRAASGALVLSGTVSSLNQMGRILAVAERFAPESVTNLLKVKGSQQVMLAVRFAEMQRTAVKELGFNNEVFANLGDATFRLLTGAGIGTETFGLIAGSFTGDDIAVDSMLDALERDGVIRTLAEPNLIARSGETASFLAGGEFPIPVAQDTDAGGATITIEFKEFGVSLAFTPTVLDNDVISLVVAPEVSAIDPSVSISTENLTIPGLSTRRARTTVDLGNGQSFAIAGLLQNELTNNIDRLPGLGNIPVLGALFRSANYRRNETELVIIVTPYLVKPATPGQLAIPTDGYIPPSDNEFFWLGRVEGVPGDGIRVPPTGIDGPHGYIIR